MPVLKPFQATWRNEPFKALLFTLSLSEISVLVANFDIVTSRPSLLACLSLSRMRSNSTL